MGNIFIADYDPDWPRRYRSEVEMLQRILSAYAPVFEHVGSTSVPQLRAKPIIDMSAGLTDGPIFDHRVTGDGWEGDESLEPIGSPDHHIFVRLLIEAGYLYGGEKGIRGRLFFLRKINNARAFHLHIFPMMHPARLASILFRDYLRAHRDAALEYEKIKVEAARLHPDFRGKYNAHKEPVILAILEKAKDWAEKRVSM